MYVRGGIYAATNETIHVTTGQPTLPVTFAPYPGEQVVLDGTGAPSTVSHNIVALYHSDHVVFDGFELRNSQWGGLQVVDSQDVTVSHCLIHDTQTYGLIAAGQHLMLTDNQIWNVVLNNAGNSTGACGCWASALNTLYQAGLVATQDVTIRNNQVHDAWGEGIGAYGTDGAVIQNNRVHDVYSFDLYLSQARNVVIDANELFASDGTHNRSGYPATGVGMATEPAPGMTNQASTIMLDQIVISNNLILGAGNGIFYFYDNRNVVPQNSYQNVHIEYNVVRSPANTAILFQAVQNGSLAPSGIRVRNNIVEQGGSGHTLLVGDPAGWTFAHNDWPNGVPSLAIEPGSFAADPQFANPVVGGAPQGFAPLPTSPVIGAATPLTEVTADFAGVTRDATHPAIGAFEPSLTLERSSLRIGVVKSGGTLVWITPSQTVGVTNPAGAWTAASDQPFVTVTPTAGTNTGMLTIQVGSASGLPVAGAAPRATITVTSPGLPGVSATIVVDVTVYAPGSTADPFGSFDTPIDQSTGMQGAIPITGWALDDIGIDRVELWRDPAAGDPAPSANGKIYIGNATFVSDARPDVAAAYPLYPQAYHAAWGYMLLTNLLPNVTTGAPAGGLGLFNLYAYIYDVEGRRTILPTRTFSCDNTTATLPFGTIDTPSQGQTVSGIVANFGWVLTPLPGMVPADGHTITLFIDSVPQPTAALYGFARSDVQTMFPGYENSIGPVGFFSIDTTPLANGVHTIAWSVSDDLSRAQGIGSRYFTSLN